VKRVSGAEPLAEADRPDRYPKPGAPEVAFLGRSNVGKSSLLNRLAGRRQLARTSATPGKTRKLYWYRLRRGGAEVWLVDLPGYGWARVSRQERRSWQRLVEAYLEERPTLCAAVLLQDLRRDLGEDEMLLLEWLAEREVPVLLALTKVDKLKPMRRAARVRELRAGSGLAPARVIPTSAEKGIGIAELWRAIDGRLASAGPRAR
jgi:GTP-binding protein